MATFCALNHNHLDLWRSSAELRIVKTTMPMSLFKFSRAEGPVSSTPSNNPQAYFIESIPEDVLAMVFDFVVSQDRTPFSALKLSHVSRRFRVAALSNPQLWTCISGSERHPEMGLINACLERSRDMPLTVHLNVYLDAMYGPSCDGILTAAKPHSHRWQTVVVRFVHIPHALPDFSVGFVGAVKGLAELQTIDTPALERLELENDMWNLEEELDFFATWKTRSMRNIVAVHGFPFQLPNIQSISTLDVTLSLRTTNFRTFLALLSKMSALTDFSIFLDNHQRDYTTSDAPFPDTSLDSVQRLRITVAQNRPHDDFSEGLEKAVYRALNLPNAQELGVSFIGELAISSDRPPQTLFHEEVDRIFGAWHDLDKLAKRPKQFPRVSRLKVNFTATNPGISVNNPGLGVGIGCLVLPLNIFPELKELRVESELLLDLGVYNIEEYEQPALRRIILDVPRLNSSNTEAKRPSKPPLTKWLRALADTLITQGKWDDFQEVVLTERVIGLDSSSGGVRRWEVRTMLSRDTLSSSDGRILEDDLKTRRIDRASSIGVVAGTPARDPNAGSQSVFQNLSGRIASMFTSVSSK